MRKSIQILCFIAVFITSISAKAFVDGIYVGGIPIWNGFWSFSLPAINISIPNIKTPLFDHRHLAEALALQENQSRHRPDVDASNLPPGAGAILSCYLDKIEVVNRENPSRRDGASLFYDLRLWNFRVVIDNSMDNLGRTYTDKTFKDPQRLPPNGDHTTVIDVFVNVAMHQSEAEGIPQTVDELLAETVLHEIVHHFYPTIDHSSSYGEGDRQYWIDDAFIRKFAIVWEDIFKSPPPRKSQARGTLIEIPTCGSNRVVIPDNYTPYIRRVSL